MSIGDRPDFLRIDGESLESKHAMAVLNTVLRLNRQAISKKGFWFRIAAEADAQYWFSEKAEACARRM